MVFNPSSVDRLSHAIIGGFLSGSFLVLSVSARCLLKGRFVEIPKAAFEGHYAASGPADMYLLGRVDTNTQHVTGLSISGGLSYLLHQDFNAPVRGLNSFRPEDRPPVNFVFQTYHLMVAIGTALIGLTLVAA